MIKITIKLDKRRKLNNGKYPLKIKIARKDTAFYMSTPYQLREEEWDPVASKVKLLAERKSMNVKLGKKLAILKEKVYALQESGQLRYYTNKKLQKYLLNEDDGNEEKHLFSVLFDEFLSTKNSENTKKIYISTKKKIESFCDYNTLLIEDIDIDWLDEFVKKQRNDKNRQNTIANRLRNIRAIISYAKKKKVIIDDVFLDYKIKTEETEKRSLSVEQLRTFYRACLPSKFQIYKDMFFLTFFLMGINLVDLASLERIENGRIKYKRAKTGTLYNIKIEPEAQEIIDRNKGKKYLISLLDNYKDYQCFSMRFDANATKIAELLSIPRMTLYWARHSFATIAYEIGTSTDIIADCLGHKTGHRITEIYIQKDQRKVDEANRKVIDYVLYNKK